VICTKLDRLARSVRHLVALVGELEALGVDLVVLDQAIDTATPTGRLLFHILGSIGEFETELIRERTRAAVARARREGRSPGRPRVLARYQVERVRRLARHGHSQRRIAEMLQVSKSTVLRALRERAA